MPRATCRCGHTLNTPDDGTERVVCPACGAKVRIRRAGPNTVEDGAYLRFNCPCGRRLKVSTTGKTRPTHGKCPDCGRVVPVPAENLNARDPEAPTVELSPTDLAMLDKWAETYLKNKGAAAAAAVSGPTGASPPSAAPSTPVRSEAGLRVCPGCGKPVHLGASKCRSCGIVVPKR